MSVRTDTAHAGRSPLYPLPPQGSAPLRVIVLVDKLVTTTWIAETLAALAASVEVELLAIAAISVAPPPRLSLMMEIFLRFDATLAGAARAATAPISLPGRLPEVVFMACAATQSDARLEISENDQERLAALQPDLVLSFGLPPAGPRLGRIARLGIWSFGRYASDPLHASLWLLEPILRGDPVTGSGIVVHMSDVDSWQLLRPSWSATSQLSFARNRAHQLLRVPALMLRSVRQILRGETIERHPPPSLEIPGLLAMTGFGIRLVVRALRRQLPRVGKIESWFIAARRGSQRIDPYLPRPQAMRQIESPNCYYWADPCAVRYEGRNYVFVEEYVYATRRGRIAVIELDDDLNPGRVHRVLQTPWHLSYPFVFEWQGDHYMSVESSEAQCVALYRAVSFPDRWEAVTDLLRGWNIVDATIHNDGKHWYLFANITESPFGYDERIWDDLFLFYADSPLGPWHPHPANPIVSDARHARPGGRLFEHKGKLIRPSQDCSVDYGYSVVFNEVVTLDLEHYSERTIGRLEPDWWNGLKGCHTYSACEDLEVLDAKTMIWERRAQGRQVSQS